MHIRQGPCLQHSEINQNNLEKAQHGKWYQRKPRTFIVEANAKYLAVAFNCFERLAAAFLKIIRIDYFKYALKAEAFKILDPKKPIHKIPEQISPPQPVLKDPTPPVLQDLRKPITVHVDDFPQSVNQKPADYNLDKAIDLVRSQAVAVANLNKKYCLFLCRGAQQSVPQNPDEVWVTLDETYKSPFDPSRIHLEMDINDQRLRQIFGLFDKVILDVASFTAVTATQPWRPLRDLLKKSPEAVLITQTNRHYEPRSFAAEMYVIPIHHATNAREGLIQYPFVLGWDAEKMEAAKIAARETALNHIVQYLQTLFTNVILEKQKPFPGQTALRDYFVMTGPKG